MCHTNNLVTIISKLILFINYEIPQLSVPTESVADEAVNEEMDDRLVRAATTASSLEAERDSGNIAKTQSKATPNESSSQGTDSGGDLGRQDTMGDVVAQTREDRQKLNELMDLCTNLQNRVLDLKTKKTTQAQQIDSLKRRVKKLEKKKRSRAHKLKRLYKVGLSARVESSDDEGLGEEDTSKYERIIDDLDPDEDITLVNDQENFDTDKDLQGEEVVVEQEVAANKEPIVDAAQVSAAATIVTIDDITLAKALEALKTLKPKIRGIVLKDHEEPKPLKLKKKDQILFDEEVSRELQEEIYKEEILVGERARQEEEDNIASIETWKDIQAKVDADYQLAERLNNKSKTASEIILEEDIAIDAIPLAVKTLIVDWKIYKEGKKSYYQIIRAGGKSKNYLVFSYMLKYFDREDVETLWKLVKAKYGSTRPEEDYDRLSIKKLDTLKKNIKFRGELLGLKGFLMVLEFMLLMVEVKTVSEELLLLKNFKGIILISSSSDVETSTHKSSSSISSSSYNLSWEEYASAYPYDNIHPPLSLAIKSFEITDLSFALPSKERLVSDNAQRCR
nr:hypothetical protein [Tanacetum cinerariifolium]